MHAICLELEEHGRAGAVSGIEALLERLEREVERVLPWLDPALWLPPS